MNEAQGKNQVRPREHSSQQAASKVCSCPEPCVNSELARRERKFGNSKDEVRTSHHKKRIVVEVRCHAPLPKICENGVAMRVDDV